MKFEIKPHIGTNNISFGIKGYYKKRIKTAYTQAIFIKDNRLN